MSAQVEVKTAGLEEKALAWAVARATGQIDEGETLERINKVAPMWWMDYEPQKDWAQGGPLIERYHIQTSYNGRGFRTASGEYWCAYVCNDAGVEQRPSGGGDTPLVAACRAIVATKFPDTVSVPAELVGGGV